MEINLGLMATKIKNKMLMHGKVGLGMGCEGAKTRPSNIGVNQNSVNKII